MCHLKGVGAISTSPGFAISTLSKSRSMGSKDLFEMPHGAWYLGSRRAAKSQNQSLSGPFSDICGRERREPKLLASAALRDVHVQQAIGKHDQAVHAGVGSAHFDGRTQFAP